MTEKKVPEDYPVTDFYKGHVLDAETLVKNGGWWSAVLLINDPKTNKPFIGLYRWQKGASGWKVRKRFTFKTHKDLNAALQVIERFAAKLE